MRSRIIAAMIVLMFVTIATAGIYAQSPKVKMDKKGSWMRENILDKLKLTDEQTDQISKLRTDFQTKMVDLKATLQKNTIALKALRKKDDLTRNEVIASVEAVNKAKNDIAIAIANHLMDIREILTPEQRKIAQEHLSDMFMGKRRHGMMWRNFDWNRSGNK
jgi:Spy/CpxP family protein refolding chaperone